MNAYAFIIKMKDYATSKLKNVASSVGVVDKKMDGVNSSAGRVGTSFGKLISLAGGLAVGFGLITAASNLFFKGVEFEQTKVKFEVLLGSVEKGTAMLKELNEYSNGTPYSNDSIIKGAETMLGFGIAQEKVMGNMKMLGDVAMGNQEKLGGLSLVYSQVMATGRLMGQDMNQMINQGFNPLQIISDNTGISMGNLKDQMEKGAISAEMVEEAFRLATSEGGRYHGMTGKMAETAGGLWSTFMGKMAHNVALVGSKFANWMIPLIEIGIAVADNIMPFGKAIFEILNWITQCTPLLIVLGTMALAVGANFLITSAGTIASSISLAAYNVTAWLAVTATSALELATAGLNFVMNMNPISWVILAIGALIAIVWVLWDKFEWLRGGVMGIWEVMKGFGTAIKDYVITRFHELLSGLTGIGQALVAFFKGDFANAWEIGKKATSDLIGVDSKKKLLADGIAAGKSFSTGYDKGVNNKTAKTVAESTGEKTSNDAIKKQNRSSVFDALGKNVDEEDKKKKARAKKGDGIVSGGSKLTNITITIGKLQDKTEIHVSNAKEGVDKLGEKVQEMLLRSVNSINQMQTS